MLRLLQTLPSLSFTVPKPSALFSWYVRPSTPMVPAFLLCLCPRPIVCCWQALWQASLKEKNFFDVDFPSVSFAVYTIYHAM